MQAIGKNQEWRNNTYVRLCFPEAKWETLHSVETLLKRKKFERLVLSDLKCYSPWNYEHSIKVENLASRIGIIFGLSAPEIKELRISARLHDIGKLWIPSGILEKPGILTGNERRIMNRHSEYSYQILMRSRLYPFSVCAAVLEHHFPYREMREPSKITEILQAADCAEAMLAVRPYKKGRTIEEVIDEFKMEAGNRYRYDIALATVSVLKKDAS